MSDLLERLSEVLPIHISLNYLQSKVLASTESEAHFLDSYFPTPIRLLLSFPDYYFSNPTYTLKEVHRNQIVGLVSLCRFPLNPSFVKKLQIPLSYGSDYLHKIKTINENKRELGVVGEYYSLEQLNIFLPAEVTKDFLCSEVFTDFSKTSQLSKYFSEETLLAIGIGKDEYKKMKSFFFYRNSIIGLLINFQIPINPSYVRLPRKNNI